MKYALISDIHSNLEALTEVLNDISRRSVDQLICLGDIVGYGASPKECIELVKKECSIILCGNHDHAVIGMTDKEYFNINAKRAVEWTGLQLDDSDISFLKKLPFTIKTDTFIAAHANLLNPCEWGYILDEFDADATFSEMHDSFLCFIGHSHVPLAFENGVFVDYIGYFNNIQLNAKSQYIVNAGSVGQPRDGINSAAYIIFDSTKLSIDLIRIPYDIKTAQKKILNAGLPQFLAERIQHGR